MKEYKRNIFIWIICMLSVVLLAVPAAASANDPSGDSRSSVVRIVSEGTDMISCASGFAIGQKGSAAQYFVTSKTAIGDTSACYAVQDYLFDQSGNTGNIVPLTQVWSDGGLDLVILKSGSGLQRFTPVCVSSGKSVGKGDLVYMMGYYLTQDNILPSGVSDVIEEANFVSELSEDNLGGGKSMLFEEEITIDLLGGPVIDKTGEMVGVFTLGTNSSGYVARAVYGSEVIAAAKKAGIDIWSSSSGAEAEDYWWILVFIGAGAIGGWAWKKRGKEGKRKYRGTYSDIPQNSSPVRSADAVMPQRAADMPPVQKNSPPGIDRPPIQPGYAAAPGEHPEHFPVLTGVRGYFMNNSVPVRDTIRIGRDSRRCHLIYPEKEPGISSLHCEIVNMGGTANLIDRGSTYGTYLADGTRLGANQPYPLAPGTEFYIGTRENVFRIDL